MPSPILTVATLEIWSMKAMGKATLFVSSQACILTPKPSANIYALVGLSLVAGQGQSNPRSCQCPLLDESLKRLLERDTLRFPRP